MGTFRNRLVAIATILALFVTDPGSSRSVNISSSWLLPQNDFPVFYRHFRDRVTWFEADAVCQFHHAQLATVESSNQFEAVRNYLEELDVAENVWIGLKRNSEASEFTWTNYQPLARSGYFREEVPRSSDPVCVVTDPKSNYKWHSLHCGGPEVASFVCELPVPYWASKSNGCMTSMMDDMTVTFLPEHPAIQLTKECSPGISKNVTCRGNMKQSEIMEKLSCPNSKLTKTSFDEVQLRTTTSSSEADLEDYAIEMATIAQYNDETIQSISKVIRQTRGGGLVNLPQEMSIAQEPIKSVGRGGFDTNGIDSAFISSGLAETTATSTTTTTKPSTTTTKTVPSTTTTKTEPSTTTTKTEPSTTTTTTVRPTTVTTKRTPTPATTSRVHSIGGTSTTTVATTPGSTTTTKHSMSTTIAGLPKATTKAPIAVSKADAVTTTIATTTTTSTNDQHYHHHRRPALDSVSIPMITTSTTPKVVSTTIRNSNTTATPQVVSAAARSSSTEPAAATTVVISKTTPPAAIPTVDKPTTTTSRTPVTEAYTTAKIPRTTTTVIRAPAAPFTFKPRVYKKIDLPQLPMMEDDDDDDNFLRRFTTAGPSYAASVTAAKIPHTVATTRSPVAITVGTPSFTLPAGWRWHTAYPTDFKETTGTVSNHLTTGTSVTGNSVTPRPATTRPTTASPTQTRPMTVTTTSVKVTTKTAPADNHTSRVTVNDDNWKPTPASPTPSSSASVTTSEITTTTPTVTTITAANTTPTVTTNNPHRKANNYDVYVDHPNRNRHFVRPKQQHHHSYPFILYRLLG